MKLFLSSYKFGNHIKTFARLAGSGARVAVIMNAVDWGDVERAQASLETQIHSLNEVDLKAEQLDLRDFFGKAEELENRMNQFDAVWVVGGNAFVLKRAYEQSGFDMIIKKLVLEDKIVYGAFSAGVVVVTPTLKGVEMIDDVNIVPDGYDVQVDIQGLGLIEYAVAMHYKSDHPESALIDQYVEYCEEKGIPIKTLRDGEVIVVEDGERRTLPIGT